MGKIINRKQLVDGCKNRARTTLKYGIKDIRNCVKVGACYGKDKKPMIQRERDNFAYTIKHICNKIKRSYP